MGNICEACSEAGSDIVDSGSRQRGSVSSSSSQATDDSAMKEDVSRAAYYENIVADAQRFDFSSQHPDFIVHLPLAKRIFCDVCIFFHQYSILLSCAFHSWHHRYVQDTTFNLCTTFNCVFFVLLQGFLEFIGNKTETRPIGECGRFETQNCKWNLNPTDSRPKTKHIEKLRNVSS